jgi:EAL domain-containing protein (putative c-di-GMP-specific phosphodiesterase class I)/GNAT superfamily N-acetyltransferase
MTVSETAQAPRYTGLSVLIIDDDDFVRGMAGRIFTALGVGRVEMAAGGAAALALVGDGGTPFDVIVCDLDMPDMDGIETLRHLAADRRHQGAGVIISSAAEPQIVRTVEELARARGLSLLGALPKPLTPAAVAALIDRLDAGVPARRAFSPVDASPDRLRAALDGGEIEPWFQPKVSLADGSLKGVEALVRWRHPEHGVLAPAAFLDAVEAAGLADAFAEHMLDASLRQAGAWTRQGLKIGVAVNVSVSALYRLDLPDVVLAAIRANGLAVGQVTLEVTESGLMHDITTPFDVITRLAMKGVRLSIDDFGTGYSTIQQLVRLPFTEFKLDMSFVRGAQENERVRIVLDSNVDMARRLNLQVVAEGIETRDNWDMLAAMHCDLAQGYFIGRPMPGDDLPQWHLSWTARLPALLNRAAPTGGGAPG